MADIEQALAEAVAIVDPKGRYLTWAVPDLAATEPMQAIARVVDAAVIWRTAPIDREYQAQLARAVAALGEATDD